MSTISSDWCQVSPLNHYPMFQMWYTDPQRTVQHLPDINEDVQMGVEDALICGKMPLCSIAFAEKWSEAQMGGRVWAEKRCLSAWGRSWRWTVLAMWILCIFVHSLFSMQARTWLSVHILGLSCARIVHSFQWSSMHSCTAHRTLRSQVLHSTHRHCPPYCLSPPQLHVHFTCALVQCTMCTFFQSCKFILN